MSIYIDLKTCRTPEKCGVRGTEIPGGFTESTTGEDFVKLPFVDAIVAAMLGTGVAKIVEADVEKIWRRFFAYEYVTGPARRNIGTKGEELPQWIQLEEVRNMLDFTIENLTALNDADWVAKQLADLKLAVEAEYAHQTAPIISTQPGAATPVV